MANLTKIKKRNGEIVDFRLEKISNAIFNAAKAVGGRNRRKAENLAINIKKFIESKYTDENPPYVEDIQDIVEKFLIEAGHAKTAKSYILYREKHSEIRKFGNILNNIETINSYVAKLDWRVKENSNMAYSLQGLNNYISSIVTTDYWLNKVYNQDIEQAHHDGDFHIHDLSILGPYCVGWDLKDLLVRGFGGVQGKIHSKPAKHFRAALGQVVNFFYTLQGEAAGAQAFSNFDTLLSPFIRYDNLDYVQVKQALQEFLYNLNVPTRVGFQTPFTNITLDLKCPSIFRDEPVIIGGKPQKESYGNFKKEMDMFNKAFVELMIEGDAMGRVFSFPIPTYNITKDFDWDNENYNPIWEMTAKYGIPYFANFVNSDMSPDDARSMCCRLRLDNRTLNKRGGGLFGANPLTGSLGVVTINLPRVGYLSKNVDEFKDRVGELMDLAKDSLEMKREIIEKFTDLGLYPYSKYYLQSIKKRDGKYWGNHFSTIGLVGMNEAIINLIGKPITDAEGRKVTLNILDYMREKMLFYQEETGNHYNLEATPAEGTSFRLAKIDKMRYPKILVANEEKHKNDSASPYYTNSTQLPVGYTQDLFHALDMQDEIQCKYTGGTVFHIFLGERMPDIESTKNLVRKIAKNYKMPYYTLSPTFSICPIHGYLSGEHEYCPKCDEENGIVIENTIKDVNDASAKLKAINKIKD
jgi:ribonucleoside-triphosphate reductase (formate)